MYGSLAIDSGPNNCCSIAFTIIFHQTNGSYEMLHLSSFKKKHFFYKFWSVLRLVEGKAPSNGRKIQKCVKDQAIDLTPVECLRLVSLFRSLLKFSGNTRENNCENPQHYSFNVLFQKFVSILCQFQPSPTADLSCSIHIISERSLP